MPVQPEHIDVVLSALKPIGWTSNDAIRFIKRRVTVKVGHAGTLDPFADGLLLICLGRATKRVPGLMGLEKEYHAVFELGTTTDTLDITGQIIRRDENFACTRHDLEAIIKSFVGEIEQKPPAFSAVQIEGQRAYQLAREGHDVNLEARRVTIRSINLINVFGRRVEMNIACSKGTYIRSLARDMAEALGTCGYVRRLTRTRIGNYQIKDAETLSQLQNRLDNF